MTATNSFQEELSQITFDVFAAMLKTPLSYDDSLAPNAIPFQLEGSVSFAGAWNGRVILRCTTVQAQQWATRLMSIAEPNLDDMHEAVAELTNMVAGNLKAILPPKNRLGLPTVLIGPEPACPDPTSPQSSEVLNSIALLNGNFGPFRVLLTQVQEN